MMLATGTVGMSRTKRLVLVVVALALLGTVLLRSVPVLLSVVWIFLWWGGVVRDNSSSPVVGWMEAGLYVLAVLIFAAAAVVAIQWVRKVPAR
jgi:hypothetical protein